MRRTSLATPGDENMSTRIELTNMPLDGGKFDSSDSQEEGLWNKPTGIAEHFGQIQDWREDSTDGLEVIGTAKPTPLIGTTAGSPEGEYSFREQSPSVVEEPYLMDEFKEFSDFVNNKSEIGDCNFCWRHKVCCFVCLIFLLVLSVILLVVIPRPLQYCVAFSFDDQNAMNKVSGDEGHFDMQIKNRNFIPVSIQEFEINTYYGGVNEVQQLINVPSSDYSIGAKNTLSTNNRTYVFAQDSTDVVPAATLRSCSEGNRVDLTYHIVTSFKGCLMPFICKSGIVLESSYVNRCLEDNYWECTDFGILG